MLVYLVNINILKIAPQVWFLRHIIEIIIFITIIANINRTSYISTMLAIRSFYFKHIGKSLLLKIIIKPFSFSATATSLSATFCTPTTIRCTIPITEPSIFTINPTTTIIALDFAFTIRTYDFIAFYKCVYVSPMVSFIAFAFSVRLKFQNLSLSFFMRSRNLSTEMFQ